MTRRAWLVILVACCGACGHGCDGGGSSPPGPMTREPHPQPLPGPSTQCSSQDGVTCDQINDVFAPYTLVETPEGRMRPGQNMLKTIDSNNFDSNDEEMLNTDPSLIGVPFDPDKPVYAQYNLIDGVPEVSAIDMASPTDDLGRILQNALTAAQDGTIDQESIRFGLDLLEGNPLPTTYRGESIAGRVYGGFALLHYTAPERIKAVTPIRDGTGKVIGGNVDIHQIWFDQNIESDTAMLDASAVQDVPWTITYTVDVLHRGNDDFAPFVGYFDAPPMNTPGAFGEIKVGMDAVFFPMSEGTRTVMKVKMAQGRYLNIIYHWGWRRHPPRIQVTENALKQIGGLTLPQWTVNTFGPAPRASRANQLRAIAQLAELSPAKRIWQALSDAQAASSPAQVVDLMMDAQPAFDDFLDRTRLPTGVEADPHADVTLFYANNTIYGSSPLNLSKWVERGTTLNITLLNGDHFMHGYVSIDFGGSRGWENQFQNTDGSGCDFTFGRDYLWINAGGPWGAINVPPVSIDGTTPGMHKIRMQMNFEPNPRLRLYQYDPMHHDVSIFSLH
ncbi:MAG: hypothetical protein ACRERC_07560 [Candidatus Binatia bacterium]